MIDLCGPRLLAQYRALEGRLARIIAGNAAEIAQVRRRCDELASYVVDLRRWLAESSASAPPGLGASAEEIRRFEEQLCNLEPARCPA